MVPQWFIEAKRDAKEHSEGDLRAWVQGITDGSLPDYQISAWLMAVYLRGMTPAETATLTDAMMRSGECLHFDCPQPTADKHSTGGIGDKLSIPLAPLCAAMGMVVPMISGRGLGITGGTLDKLESIPGFNVRLSIPQFQEIAVRTGCCMIGQTETLAPADRRLYALRDVTGTVASIPLITASIMSKKLAEGAQTLVFDVKFGRGAFMQTREEAEALATSLIAAGKRLGRKCRALLTDMNQPLGRTVGNALEIRESLEILDGKGPRDVRELTLLLAAHMAQLSGLYATVEAALTAATAVLDSGAARAKFAEMVEAQGGTLAQPLPKAAVRLPVLAPRAGIVRQVDALTIGKVALKLGAGRTSVHDVLDLAAGIDELVQQGESVEAGAPLCWLNGADCEKVTALVEETLSAFTIDTSAPPRELLHKVID